MPVLRYILLLALCALAVNLKAQPAPASGDFIFEHLTTGLPSSSVVDVVQDRQGFMWFATLGGLVRYDGTDFTSFYSDSLDATTISHDQTECLYVDRAGTLWVGTWGGGLNRYEEATETFTRYLPDERDPQSISDHFVTDILEDSQGVLWVGTQFGGLNRMDRETGTFTSYRHDPADLSSLSYDEVRVLYEDARGTLWVGTGDPFVGTTETGGLNRFDRQTETFTRYLHDPGDPTSLIDNRVSALYEDTRGTFWVGTVGHGLHVMDREAGTFTRYTYDPDDPDRPSSPRHSTITTNPFGGSPPPVRFIREDRTGALWIGSFGGAVDRFDPDTGRRTHFEYDPGNPNGPLAREIWQLYESRDGTLWLATWSGVSKIYPVRGRFTLYDRSPESPEDLISAVRAVYKDRDGVLWLGTGGGGLIRMDREKRLCTRYRHDPSDPASLGDDWVRSIHEDHEGVFWIGTGGGLDRFDRETGTFAHFRHDSSNPASLSHDQIAFTPMVEDREGALWIGTNGGGLNRFDRAMGTFTRYSPPKAHDLRALVQAMDGLDEDGRSLAALLRIRNDQDTTVTFDIAEETTVLIAALGRYHASPEKDYGWIENAQGEVVWEMDFQEARRVAERGEIKAQVARETLGPGRYRLRYRSYSTGVYGYDAWGDWPPAYPERWGIQVYALPPGENPLLEEAEGPQQTVSGLYVSALLEDRDGTLWVGTETGIDRLDRATDTFIHYGFPRERVAWISSLFEDRQGRLWVGTWGDGLYRFDKNTETPLRIDFRREYGHRWIRGIVEDDRGILWITSSGTMTRFDPETETVRHFDELDGVPISDFYWGSYHRGRRGELFFGGREGLLSFTPDRLVNATPPEVRLTNLYLFNDRIVPGQGGPLGQPIWQTEAITLNYEQRDLTLDYAGLLYNDPGAMTYRYMLEGYDAGWVEARTQRTARYANLQPNTYTFRVKAISSDGVVSTEEARLDITILPPWWRTWWAHLLYGLVLVGAVVGAHRYQRARLLRRAEMEQARLRAEAAELQARALEAENERNRIEAEKAHELEAAYHQLRATNEQLHHHETQLERQAQILQEQTEHLLELEQTKDRFFANITHEFRTPLTLILGPVQDALMGAYGSVSPGLHRQLESMKRNAQRLHRLIGQLLDLSRLDVGGVPLQARQRNLIPFLKGIVLAFSSLAERRRVTLQFFAETDALPLYFDADKLEKIVANLLSNAFKFTPEQGMVRVSVREAADAGEHFAEIRIRDTGPGIPAEEARHIFDRFHQIDAAPHRKNEGTGIGLALVYELVALHAGTIAVESEQGFGCEFTVRLPLGKAHLLAVDLASEDADEEPDWAPCAPPMWLDEPASSHPVADPAETPGGPDPSAPTILIVEDNADMRVYLKDHLAALYHLVEAADGVEGLEAARAAAPDLIISDVMMPRMDGYALCRALKQDEHLNHIPVVLLTAKASDEAEVEGFGAGCDDYIYKPFSAEALLARVENMIEIRRLLRQRFSGEVVVQPSGVAVPSEEAVFLGRVQAAVEAHLGDSNFTVEWLADEVGLSPRQLGRRLQAAMRLSPSGFIRMMRLKRAAQLLAQQSGTVAEVAYRVGYDAKHFSRLFFQTFGVHPSEYRADQI